MKLEIEVADEREAEALKRGLECPDVRAFVCICGVMDGLPTVRAQARVLRYVMDWADEQREIKAGATR